MKLRFGFSTISFIYYLLMLMIGLSVWYFDSLWLAALVIFTTPYKVYMYASWLGLANITITED